MYISSPQIINSFLGIQADVDNSGTIDYGEFIAATLHLNKIEKEDHLFRAFSYFDKDGSGYITQDELQKACEEFGIEDGHLEEMIREADQNNVSTSSDNQPPQALKLYQNEDLYIVRLIQIRALRLCQIEYSPR